MTCWNNRFNVRFNVRLCAVLTAAVVTMFAAAMPLPAAFIPLAQHNGAVDPLTTGWSMHHGDGPGDTQFWGPVYNDNDTGLDAWYIYDTSSEGNTLTRYRQFPTAQQLSYLKATGWKLKTVMRVPNEAGAPSDGSTAVFRDGSRLWSMSFGLIGGDTTVDLTGGQRYTLTGQGNDNYHEFLLQYDPANETAQLYVDGIGRLNPIAGATNTWTDFYFGSNSSAAVGWGHYHHVSLVPEPSSAMLAMFGAVWLGFLSRRRRSRST